MPNIYNLDIWAYLFVLHMQNMTSTYFSDSHLDVNDIFWNWYITSMNVYISGCEIIIAQI